MRRLAAGRSLLRVLFVSITVVSITLYVLLQLMEPNPAVPLNHRLNLPYLLETSRGSGVSLAVFIVLLMVTVGVLLQLSLRPVRDLSDHAKRIGPSNLHERLSAGEAPSEIEPLVSAFNTSLDRLEEAWQAQRSFSANAAHELRTPLAALRAQVESLLPADHRQDAIQEFERLSRLITQLLALSEGEHGPLRRIAPFDLVGLVKDVALEFAPIFVRAQREIALDVNPLRPVIRQGDAFLVELAVRNLIENALRHTPNGVGVTMSVSDAGVVCVADDGPGLPPDFLERAFQPFMRGDPNSAGAGLGLSIVARIARLHGGEAWAETSHRGAVFQISFPARF